MPASIYVSQVVFYQRLIMFFRPDRPSPIRYFMRNARCCDAVFGRIARGRGRRNAGAVALPEWRPKALGLIVRKSRAELDGLSCEISARLKSGRFTRRIRKMIQYQRIGARLALGRVTKRSPTSVVLPRIRRFRLEFDQNQAKDGQQSVAELRRERGDRAPLPAKIGFKNPHLP